MKIKTKKEIFEFNEYFKSLEELKAFIKENNKFINVNNLDDKIIAVYNELSILDTSIKSSILGWIVVKQFNFKRARPNNINFWLERGFGIDEFNEYNKSKCSNNQFNVNVKNGEIIPLNDDSENNFHYGNFKFKSFGIPKCNLCKSELDVVPSLGRYKINGCTNLNCETHKNKEIDSIRQLGFLPIELYLNKNNRININTKTSKEYWLLKGFTYLDSLNEIEKVKEMLIDVNVNSFKYYSLTTDMCSEEIENIIATPTTERYWINKGLTSDEAKIKISELQRYNSSKLTQLRKDNPNDYSATTQTQLGYWVNKGYSSDEAKLKLSERQTTFSKGICVKKYGEVEGVKRFTERQKKWLLNHKRSNFSNISQKLFWDILENGKSISNNEIYFATYNNGNKDESGKNYEYRLDVIESYILPDFFDKTSGKIIEFDGVYYHRKSPENDLRETKRDEMIIQSGYEVLHINELDYKNNKQEIINKCIAFLNDN